ncbi:hypothetical protein [Microbacterium sp.]|uniref:hypothetical protein n=1 Tax=Microbacterium sp. TaxID=51671 RepID=UPI0035626BEA
MQFAMNDHVGLSDGTTGKVVESFSSTPVELFDLGGAEPALVYWVLLHNGQVCRFTEDSLVAA